MISIKGKPMIYHIMKHYSKYGFKNFYVTLGYKGHVIKKFLKKFILVWIKFNWNGKKQWPVVD